VAAADPVPLATDSVDPARRVTLVGVDGIGARQLRRGVASGRLPEFAALLERGSFAPLETLQPALGPPVWTSIATGRSPRDHGVKSFVTYRLRGGRAVYELLPRGTGVRALERAGLVTTAPVTAASRRSPALWTALNAFGIQTGVVRFWGTHPPEPVQGFMLSNYFHLLRQDPDRVRTTLFPPDLAAEVAARGVSAGDVEGTLVSEFLDRDPPAPPLGEMWESELVERALAPDLTYRRAAEVLRSAYDPPFFAIYFYGADVVGHSFTRFAQPDDFGSVSAASSRRYGRVVDRYAAFLGRWIGEQAAALGPDHVLLVVSGYGMEPVSPWRRLVSAATGAPDVSGTHAGGPPGFLIAVGDGVRRGAELEAASVLDVAPTVLHLMGLPVARDMDGRVLTGLLDPDVAARQPVTYIPSYASLAVTAPTAAPAADLPALLDDRP
jgi:predicted AlkP superfamily phosphohydrolase/phosphomutase